ncbi:MAG TPA: helix-turn-helix domain-containing protein [Firmicutes bacterium]|jgi:transcriptional regulator with XRE-family HTH domain|nr:helix-turn-helix domain-containing protein [Bacillota bacterium]
METLGDRLRKARESLGLSIEDVHDATKIRVAYLIAMEEGRLHELPGDVYARGFLKNVAKAVGLEGDELVSEYDRICKDSEIEQTKINDRGKADTRKRHKSGGVHPVVTIGLIIVVIAVIALVLWRPQGEPDVDTVDALDISADISALQHNSRDIPEIPFDTSLDIHELTAVVTERCWAKIIVDGHRVFEKTMLPGETNTWKGKHEIRMRLGNAGGVVLIYNGVHMGSPGKSGDVIELSFPIPGP